MQTLELPTQQVSETMAARLADCLSAPLVLTFRGEIGAGKTTFIRAMLRRLGIRSAIKSPTFSLVETYVCPKFMVHHFDLYRIQDESELDWIGFRDYFAENAICCIEWPERAFSYLAKPDLQCSVSFEGVGRRMQLEAYSDLGAAALSCFLGEA